MRSITRRTVGTVLLAQVLGAIVLSGLALVHERHTRFRALDEVVRGRSDSLLGAIQDADDPEDNVTIDPAELKLPAADRYAVYNPDGRVVGRAAGAAGDLLVRRQAGFRDVKSNGVRYRVYQRDALRIIDRLESNGVGLKRPVTIVYAAPETRVEHQVFEAARFYAIAVTVVAVLTLLLVLVLLKKALQPLADLADATRQLRPPVLSFVAPPSALKVRELRPLSDALSGVVGSLRLAFEKEQRFVGDAAHELKTAVAVVRSTVQVLMLRFRVPDEYNAGLERVLRDNERVENLVAQMLRLERGDERSLAGATSLDLRACVSEVVSELESMASTSGVRVTTHGVERVLVRLPADRAAQLVSNLVVNAIQYSAPGMEVKVTTSLNESGGAVLEVKDQGKGIGKDALPLVFERFFREDPSRSRETGGAGLGLSICKSIVEGVDGHIEIASESGQGTVVTVTFRPT